MLCGVMGNHISACLFVSCWWIHWVSAPGGKATPRMYRPMLFETGCLPKCTMGQPDVLPANMVRLTASLFTGTHALTDMEADK